MKYEAISFYKWRRTWDFWVIKFVKIWVEMTVQCFFNWIWKWTFSINSLIRILWNSIWHLAKQLNTKPWKPIRLIVTRWFISNCVSQRSSLFLIKQFKLNLHQIANACQKHFLYLIIRTSLQRNGFTSRTKSSNTSSFWRRMKILP